MALCFEVRINDSEPVVAGLDDVTVLSAIVTFAAARSELECRVGGLVSHGAGGHEQLEWLERTLQVGDRVSIRVIESDRPSVPVRREQSAPEFEEQEERKYCERLKAKYDNS